MFWVVFYTDVYIETEIIVIIVVASSYKYTTCRDGAVQYCAVQHLRRATAWKQAAASVNHTEQILYHSVLALTNAKGGETIST